MPEAVDHLAGEVIAACRDLGFALAGICPARPSDRAPELDAWLAAGKHGTMSWMTRLLEQRKDPRDELAGARSVVMVADRYADGSPDPAPHPDEPRGRIARYARGRDYHVVMKKRLHRLADRLRTRFPQHQFRSFVDTAPVMEREHAQRAGLGWIGKHTLLINRRAGSFLTLGGMLTTLDLCRGARASPVNDHCGTCTRCIDACPTGAISPYSVDARRCIAYLTIEHRGPIEQNLARHTGDWLFGCDVCQEVCPFNSDRTSSDLPGVSLAHGTRRASLNLLEVLGWTAQDRSHALGVSALKRAGLEMFKRNALIVSGNRLAIRDDPILRRRIASISGDVSESALVRGTAAEVLERSPAR